MRLPKSERKRLRKLAKLIAQQEADDEETQRAPPKTKKQIERAKRILPSAGLVDDYRRGADGMERIPMPGTILSRSATAWGDEPPHRRYFSPACVAYEDWLDGLSPHEARQLQPGNGPIGSRLVSDAEARRAGLTVVKEPGKRKRRQRGGADE